MAANEPDFSRFYGRAILAARRRKGLTQTQLATAVGLAKSRLSIIEKHGRGLNGALCRKIAKVLDTTPIELGDTAYEWLRRDLLQWEGKAAVEEDGARERRIAQTFDVLKNARDVLEYFLRAFEYSAQHGEILAPVAARRRSRQLEELPQPPEPRKRARKSRSGATAAVKKAPVRRRRSPGDPSEP